MKKEVRKCDVCGKKFTPKSANAAYCSEKCYKVAKAKKDKARKAAKKLAKVLPKPAKKSTKKVVKAVCKEKIQVNKSKHFVTVKHGDAIRFENFTPDQIFKTSISIAILACRQRFLAEISAASKKGK